MASEQIMLQKQRRHLGEHLTSVDIFKEYILPEIKEKIPHFTWVDYFCGEGNLILPILELIPENKRNTFFKEQIFLFDVQHEMVERAIQNAMKYGISKDVAENNIQHRDTLIDYPKIKTIKPIYHITNPPYLYVGYMPKHEETKGYTKYFQNDCAGLQDLYQVALHNDLKNALNNFVYIIPSNFIFGSSVSNKIRDKLLPFYNIKKAFIFEKKIFEHTGTNVIICFFEKKIKPSNFVEFEATKINSHIVQRQYNLHKRNHFRAGSIFDDFIAKEKVSDPVSINFYLKSEEIEKNKGKKTISLLDSKDFGVGGYTKKTATINEKLHQKLMNNPLFIRTVDTGSPNGRAGLYLINDEFGVDGIVVDGPTYRTNPIQVFINSSLTREEAILFMQIFNKKLEQLREKTDSEFMTTYKYSTGKTNNSTRKYFGLNQAKKLAETISLNSVKIL